MANVRAPCLLCSQPVEVPAATVVLHRRPGAATSRYGFTCPECGVYTVRRANQAVVEALLGTCEVRVATGDIAPWETEAAPDVIVGEVAPSERPGPRRRVTTTAPPLTEADVLLFRRALEDDSILAAWLAD